MTSTDDTGHPSTALLNVAAIVVIVAGIKAAAPVVVPILTAVFVSLVL